MTPFEYRFQNPNSPLIVDPFEFDEDDQALAIRVIPPALAMAAAGSILQIRTAILREANAPKDVLARYDPATESANQVEYITQSGPDVHYLSAVIGSRAHIAKLAETDDSGLPKYSGQVPLEIDPDLPEDVQEYLKEQIAKRRATEHSVEGYLQTVGLAKLTQDTEGIRIQALDVHPDFTRQSIGSLLLYKGFGAYGNHAGVQARPPEPDVRFLGVNDARQEWEPLLVHARIPTFDANLPVMLEGLGMGHDGDEYVSELREVQQHLSARLIDRGLIQAPEV